MHVHIQTYIHKYTCRLASVTEKRQVQLTNDCSYIKALCLSAAPQPAAACSWAVSSHTN